MYKRTISLKLFYPTKFNNIILFLAKFCKQQFIRVYCTVHGMNIQEEHHQTFCFLLQPEFA